MRTIFLLKDNIWTISSYACGTCGTIFKTVKYCSKHEEKCVIINRKKKREEELNMPIQRITKGGETWYRWGQSGKLYRNREDAEKQAAAAYASGYRKKESTATKDRHAEMAGRKVTKDLEYDMGHRGKDDAKAERAGKRVTKDIEYDMKRKRR